MMLTGHSFKRLSSDRWRGASARGLPGYAILAQLCQQIVERFARTGCLAVVATPLDLRQLDVTEERARHLSHPACAEFARSDYCRESWQLHLAALSRDAATHWHRCDFGRLCGVVPLVHRDRLLAVFQIACPDSMPEPAFEAQVELLDLLVKQATAARVADLDRLLHHCRSNRDGCESPAEVRDENLRTTAHPQVLKALAYVDRFLGDTQLTVGRVAHALGVHPDYLAHVFRREVGQRMSRYISGRRVARAKSLLATTDWCVKRIAHESGFANAKWFYHVFHAHTGVTPISYRSISRTRVSD